MGIFGDKTPKKPEIAVIPVPKKSPKVFKNLSPSLPRPKNSGRGWKQCLQKFWGFFGDKGRFNFEFFWGFIPENPQNIFGEILGTGISLTLGIFEFFSPKKLKFWGIPENPHSIDEYLGLSKMIGGQQGWPYKNQIVGVIYPYLPILNSS